MNDLAIRVECLGKRYRIGQREPYKALRDVLARAPLAPYRWLRSQLASRNGKYQDDGYIWALRDVTFEVKQGEVIGIIGRNGAGKSTLLKILSRITKPTRGYADIYGRVGSLLEVGTGFHPELTGRENIYLNGAILGMNRHEIERKFDEIVSFGEIEKFLDTPVKRYSSGMYVRLAFAVAAHLEPEILLVDEVLAVGDAGFQKKCIGKMSNVAEEGRTVVFVSHNMTAIQSLCDRSMLLEKGQLVAEGNSADIVKLYLINDPTTSLKTNKGKYDLSSRTNKLIPEKLIIKRIMLLDSSNRVQDTFQMGSELLIMIDVEGLSQFRGSNIGVIFKSKSEQWITSINTEMSLPQIDKPRSRSERAILSIPNVPFTPGSYWIDISVAQQGVGRLDYVEHAASFDVAEADVYGTGYQVTDYFGMIYLQGKWKIKGL
jgi:lipopolysaccharide transport system ATP-binding protein